MNASDHAGLLQAAREVRARAHAPYSGFLVGAAVLADDGRVYLGCNVENASYPEGVCAETAALAAMVAGGGRKALVVAIAGGFRDGALRPCTPCGGCRQRILEFAEPATAVLSDDGQGGVVTDSLAALLPGGFALG